MVLTLSESIQGIQVVKGFAREREEIERFEIANRAVRDQQQTIFWRVSLFSPAIGFLSQLAETRGFFTAETRTLIFIGVLGGFTTFSAFSNETINLWREGESLLATINVAAHLVLCLGAVWLSRAVAYQIWR